ncbi:MAG: protein tyrosine phosphatase family protein [Halarcobacter sp.]
MQEIINYIKINDNISSSGQPTKEQFEEIAKDNYEIIINLSSDNSENKLENEDEILSKLGLIYIHLPVDFLSPTKKNLKDFIEILSFFSEKKVWVHCIMNYRVSAFMYVYHKYILKTPFENINLEVFEKWSPDEKWQEIMKTSLDELR